MWLQDRYGEVFAPYDSAVALAFARQVADRAEGLKRNDCLHTGVT
ncbi:MAG: hypothetical protein V4812_07270 [Pseudomonadota bacterium]